MTKTKVTKTQNVVCSLGEAPINAWCEVMTSIDPKSSVNVVKMREHESGAVDCISVSDTGNWGFMTLGKSDIVMRIYGEAELKLHGSVDVGEAKNDV